MLTKEEFLNAMTFFDEFDNIKDNITEVGNQFFDGNGILFIGNDRLLEKYTNLLKRAMDIPLDEDYDPITYWLYEADERIFDKPDKNGICKCIGKADKKFWDTEFDGKEFHIENNEDLYNYIKYVYTD